MGTRFKINWEEAFHSDGCSDLYFCMDPKKNALKFPSGCLVKGKKNLKFPFTEWRRTEACDWFALPGTTVTQKKKKHQAVTPCESESKHRTNGMPRSQSQSVADGFAFLTHYGSQMPQRSRLGMGKACLAASSGRHCCEGSCKIAIHDTADSWCSPNRWQSFRNSFKFRPLGRRH